MSILQRSLIAAAAIALLLTLLPARFASTKSSSRVLTSAQNPTPTPPPAQSPTPKKPDSTEQEVDPDDVIRVKTNLVNAPVLVIGRDGKYIPSLRREDFELYEEGVKQEIAYFAPVEQPFTIALLIDTSRSTVFELGQIQDAAMSFIDNMRANDQAMVISFSDDIKVLAEATGDREQLRQAIRACSPGGGTRVYDAIDFALGERLDQVAGRKALIMFTDGVDNNSTSATFESSLRRIEKTETLIYPVQFSTYEAMNKRTPRKGTPPDGSGFSQKDYQVADNYLHRTADATGTALHPARDIAELDRAVAQIIDELHNEYSLGYYPATPGQPGEVRRIEIRVNRPQLVVRARTGYVVDASGVAVQPMKTNSNSPTDGSTSGPLSPPRSTDLVRLPLGAKWMCKSPDVPTDFVVIKEGFIAHCSKSTRANDETNAWFIRKPASNEVMCKGFLKWRGDDVAAAPIPTGYVVTGETVSPVCSTSGNPNSKANAWTIKLPQMTSTMCKGFAVPRGYVVAGETENAACPPKGGKNAWTIRPKS